VAYIVIDVLKIPVTPSKLKDVPSVFRSLKIGTGCPCCVMYM
jgi:hypothetical protein